MDSSANNEPNGSRERWLSAGGLALLFAVIVGLFLPAIRSPLAFDDMLSLNQVREFSHWTDAFRQDAFSFYRPVKNLFFYAMLQTDGDVLNLHVSTVTAYLLATAGVFMLASRLTGSSRWGLAVAAIWSLSAAHVTIAIWSSCFNISIAAASMAFGLAAWDRWREDPQRWGSLAAFILLLALALLSYETAIAMAPLAVMIDLYRGRSLFTKASMLRYAGIAVVIISWLMIRQGAGAKMGEIVNPSFPGDIERWQISASSPYFLWTHFLMWAAPWGRLECLGSYIWGQSIPASIIPFCWLFLIGTAVLAIRFWKPGNLFVFGLAWFFIAAFPSGNFIPMGNTPYADYYVPIPAIGLAFLLVALLRGLIKASRQPRVEPAARRAAWAVVIVLIGLRVANLSAFRNWVEAWSNPVVVMAETAATRPYQFLAKAAVAGVMLEANELELAEHYALASISDRDDLAQPHIVMGQIYSRRDEFDLAAQSFRTSLERRHTGEESVLDAHFRLGEIISRDPARVQEAFDNYFLPVLQRRNYLRHAETVIAAAKAFRDAERPDDELVTLRKGIDYHPDDPAIKAALKDAEQRQATASGKS